MQRRGAVQRTFLRGGSPASQTCGEKGANPGGSERGAAPYDEERLELLCGSLRAELTEKYPEITIADFDFYNVDIFNRCENSNDMLLAIKSWESVHPLMKILPVEWDYKMPYGLLYAKDPSEKVEKLVRTVEGITK